MLSPDDPRHGTQNGYGNLKCRCEPCKKANTNYLRGRQTKLGVGGKTSGVGGKISVSIPRDYSLIFRTYAKAKGRSMRSIAMEAITKYMEDNP